MHFGDEQPDESACMYAVWSLLLYALLGGASRRRFLKTWRSIWLLVIPL